MESSTGTFFAFFFLVAAVIGGGAIYAMFRGAGKVARSQELRQVGQETQGTVVDNQMHSHSTTGNDGFRRNYLTFRPVIRYIGPDGKEVTTVGPADSSKSFVVGSNVPIRYNPENPEQVEIVSGQGSGSGGISGIVGGLIAIVAVILISAFACSAQEKAKDPFKNDCYVKLDGDKLVCE